VTIDWKPEIDEMRHASPQRPMGKGTLGVPIIICDALQITRFSSCFDGSNLRVAFATTATLIRLPAPKLREGRYCYSRNYRGLGRDCAFIGLQDTRRII
jgi:hypothetical protein